jgi:hypothetical protein
MHADFIRPAGANISLKKAVQLCVICGEKRGGFMFLTIIRELAYSAGTHIRLTHGYEFFLTVGQNIETGGDIDMRQITGGVYAVLRFKEWENIGNAWEHLWNWIREKKYEVIGNQKGETIGVMDSRSRLIGMKGSCRMNGCLIYECN